MSRSRRRSGGIRAYDFEVLTIAKATQVSTDPHSLEGATTPADTASGVLLSIDDEGTPAARDPHLGLWWSGPLFTCTGQLITDANTLWHYFCLLELVGKPADMDGGIEVWMGVFNDGDLAAASLDGMVHGARFTGSNTAEFSRAYNNGAVANPSIEGSPDNLSGHVLGNAGRKHGLRWHEPISSGVESDGTVSANQLAISNGTIVMADGDSVSWAFGATNGTADPHGDEALTILPRIFVSPIPLSGTAP